MEVYFRLISPVPSTLYVDNTGFYFYEGVDLMSGEQASTRSLRAEIELLFKADEGGTTLENFKKDIDEAAGALTALDGKLNLKTLQEDMKTLMESLSKKGKNSISLQVTTFRDNLVKQITNKILTNNFDVNVEGAEKPFLLDLDQKMMNNIQEEFKNKIKERFSDVEKLFPKNFAQNFRLKFNANDVRKLSEYFNNALSDVLANGVDFQTKSVIETLADGTKKETPVKDILKLNIDADSMKKIVRAVQQKLVDSLIDPKNILIEGLNPKDYGFRVGAIDKVIERLTQELDKINLIIQNELKSVEKLQRLKLDETTIKDTAQSLVKDIQALKKEIDSLGMDKRTSKKAFEELTKAYRSLKEHVREQISSYVNSLLNAARAAEATKIDGGAEGAPTSIFASQLDEIGKIINSRIREELNRNIKGLLSGFGYEYTVDKDGKVELKKGMAEVAGKITLAATRVIEEIANDLKKSVFLGNDDMVRMGSLLDTARETMLDRISSQTKTFNQRISSKMENSFKALLQFIEKEVNSEIKSLMDTMKVIKQASGRDAGVNNEDLLKAIKEFNIKPLEEKTESLSNAMSVFINTMVKQVTETINKIQASTKKPLTGKEKGQIYSLLTENAAALSRTVVDQAQQVVSELEKEVKNINLKTLGKKDMQSLNSAIKQSVSTMLIKMSRVLSDGFKSMDFSDDIKAHVVSEVKKVTSILLKNIDLSSLADGSLGKLSPQDIEGIKGDLSKISTQLRENLRNSAKTLSSSVENRMFTQYTSLFEVIEQSFNREMQKIANKIKGLADSNNITLKIDYDKIFKAIAEVKLSDFSGQEEKLKAAVEKLKTRLVNQLDNAIGQLLNSSEQQFSQNQKDVISRSIRMAVKNLMTIIQDSAKNTIKSVAESIGPNLTTGMKPEEVVKINAEVSSAMKSVVGSMVGSIKNSLKSIVVSDDIVKKTQEHIVSAIMNQVRNSKIQNINLPQNGFFSKEELSEVAQHMKETTGEVIKEVKEGLKPYKLELITAFRDSFKKAFTLLNKTVDNQLKRIMTEMEAMDGQLNSTFKMNIRFDSLMEKISGLHLKATPEDEKAAVNAMDQMRISLIEQVRALVKNLMNLDKTELDKSDINKLNFAIKEECEKIIKYVVKKSGAMIGDITNKLDASAFAGISESDRKNIETEVNNGLAKIVHAMVKALKNQFKNIIITDEVAKHLNSEVSKALNTSLLRSSIEGISKADSQLVSKEDIDKLQENSKNLTDQFVGNIKDSMAEYKKEALKSFRHTYADVITSIKYGITRELERIKNHLAMASENGQYKIDIDFKDLFDKLSGLDIKGQIGSQEEIKSSIAQIRASISNKVKEIVDVLMKEDLKSLGEQDEDKIRGVLRGQTKEIITFVTARASALIKNITDELKKMGTSDFEPAQLEDIQKSLKSLTARLLTKVSNIAKNAATKITVDDAIKEEFRAKIKKDLGEALKTLNVDLKGLNNVKVEVDETTITGVLSTLGNLSKLVSKLNFTLMDNFSILTNELDSSIRKILAARAGMSVKDFMAANPTMEGETALSSIMSAAADPTTKQINAKFIGAIGNHFKDIQTKIKNTEFTLDPLHGESLIDVINKLMNNTFKTITDKMGRSLTAAMGGVMKELSSIDMSSMSIDKNTLQSLLTNTAPSNRRVVVNKNTSSQTSDSLSVIKTIQDATAQRTDEISEHLPLLRQKQEDLVEQKKDADNKGINTDELDKEIDETNNAINRFEQELQQLRHVLLSIGPAINGTLPIKALVDSIPESVRDLISRQPTTTRKDSTPSNVFDAPQTSGQYKEMDTEAFENARDWYNREEQNENRRFTIGGLEVDRTGRVVYDNVAPTFDYSEITDMTRPNLLERALRTRPDNMNPSVDEAGRDIVLPEGFNRRPDGVGYSKLERLYRTSEIFRQANVNKYTNYKVDDRAKNEAMAYVKEFDAVVPYLRNEITRLYTVLDEIGGGEGTESQRAAILKQIETLKSKIDLEFDRLRNLDQLLIDREKGIKLDDSEKKAQKDAIFNLDLEKERMGEFENKYSMLLDDKETQNLKSEIAQQMARLQSLSEKSPKGQTELMAYKDELSDIKRQMQLLRRRYAKVEKEQGISTTKQTLIDSLQIYSPEKPADYELMYGMDYGQRQELIDRIKNATKKQEIDDIKKTISEARKEGKKFISKEKTFEEKRTKKLDNVSFMYDLEKVRTEDIVKQFENKLSKNSMDEVKSDIKGYLDDFELLKNTRPEDLYDINDLNELDKALARISEKMKSLKSKWNDMLHDENMFYGSAKPKNQLQGMKDLGIVDQDRLGEVEKMLENARTANELKFAKDAVEQLKQEQAKLIKDSILEKRRGKLGVDKAQFISEAVTKGFSVDKDKLDLITAAESSTSTKEDISDAKKVLAELASEMKKMTGRQDKEKDLGLRAEMFVEAKRILVDELKAQTGRKLPTSQIVNYVDDFKNLDDAQTAILDAVKSVGEGNFSVDDVRAINAMMSDLTNKFQELKKRINEQDARNKFDVKKDKMLNDVDLLEASEMLTPNQAAGLRGRIATPNISEEELSRVGLDVQREKARVRLMQQAKEEGDSKLINEQRRDVKVAKINESMNTLEYSAEKSLTRGSKEFNDFIEQLNNIRKSASATAGMDVSEDTGFKLMGNEINRLNGLLTALKNRLTVEKDRIQRGTLIANDPVLANRDVSPADIERILMRTMPGIQMAGKVEVDNAKATWSAVIMNEVGQRQKLVGTIDRNISALMKHAESLDKAGNVIAAEAAQFKRIDVSDGFEYATANRDQGGDGEDVDNLSRFQNSLINTMRYMFAGTLVGYPSMMFYKGFESYKQFEFQMNKAQQNFMFKDPDSMRLAASTVQAKRDQGLISEQDYNDPEKYSQMVKKQQTDYQVQIAGGNEKQLRREAFVLGVSSAEAAQAYQIVSRRLDNPNDAMMFTRQVMKARSLEDVDIEQFTLGFEALSAQWGLGAKDIEHATNMMIKAANLTQAKIEDILLTQTRAGSIFRDTSPNLVKEDKMKALAQAITMSSFFVQATARSGKEGGTFYKSFLEKVYTDGSVRKLEKVDEALKSKRGPGQPFEGMTFSPYERREDGSYKQRDAMEVFADIMYANRKLEKRDRDRLIKPVVAQWHVGSAAALESFFKELDEQLLKQSAAIEQINEMRLFNKGENEKEIKKLEEELEDPSLDKFDKAVIEDALADRRKDAENFKEIVGTGQMVDGKKEITPLDILNFQTDSVYNATDREIAMIQAVNMDTYKFKTQQISTMFENSSAEFFEALKPHFVRFASALNGVMRDIGEGAGGLVNALALAAIGLQVFGAKYLGGFIAGRMTERRNEKDGERIDVLRKDLDNQAKAVQVRKAGLEAQVQSAFDNTPGTFEEKEAARQEKIKELTPRLLEAQAESREVNNQIKLLEDEQRRLGIDENFTKNPMNMVKEGYDTIQLNDKEVDQAYRERSLAAGIDPDRKGKIGEEIERTREEFNRAVIEKEKFDRAGSLTAVQKDIGNTQDARWHINSNFGETDAAQVKKEVAELNRQLQKGTITAEDYKREVYDIARAYHKTGDEADAFANDIYDMNRAFDKNGRAAAEAAVDVERYNKKLESLQRRMDLVASNISTNASVGGAGTVQQLAAGTSGSATASSLSNIGSNSDPETIKRRGFGERWADSTQIFQQTSGIGALGAALAGFFGGRFARNDDGTMETDDEGNRTGRRESQQGRELDNDNRSLGRRLMDSAATNSWDFIKTSLPTALMLEGSKLIMGEAIRSTQTAAELLESDASEALKMERSYDVASREVIFGDLTFSEFIKQNEDKGVFGKAFEGLKTGLSSLTSGGYNWYQNITNAASSSAANEIQETAAEKAAKKLKEENLDRSTYEGRKRYLDLFTAEIGAVQAKARVQQMEDAFNANPNQTFLYDTKGNIRKTFGDDNEKSGVRYEKITTAAEAQELISSTQQEYATKSQTATADFEFKKATKMVQGLKEDSNQILALNRELFAKQRELLEEQIKEIQKEVDLFKAANPDANVEDDPAYAEFIKNLQQLKADSANLQTQINQSYLQEKINNVTRVSDTLNFEKQKANIDTEIGINKAILGGADTDSEIVKGKEKQGLQKQNALIAGYLPQLKAKLATFNPNLDTERDQYRQVFLEIRQLEAEQVSNLVKIKETLQGNKSTFNLPAGMSVMSYYEAITEKGTHKNMSILKGGTVINITVEGNVDSQKTVDKIAQAVDRASQTDAVARGLANTINRRTTPTSVR